MQVSGLYRAQVFRDNWNCYALSLFRDFTSLASSGNSKHILMRQKVWDALANLVPRSHSILHWKVPFPWPWEIWVRDYAGLLFCFVFHSSPRAMSRTGSWKQQCTMRKRGTAGPALNPTRFKCSFNFLLIANEQPNKAVRESSKAEWTSKRCNIR